MSEIVDKHDAKALFDFIERHMHTMQIEAHECPSMDICYAYLEDKGWTRGEVETAYDYLCRTGTITKSEYVFSGRFHDDDRESVDHE